MFLHLKMMPRIPAGSIVIDGGSFTVDSGDDAFADLDVVVNDGVIAVNSCYEGLEGRRVV
ncbi:MAG: hypothetical protein ACLRMZ_02185 [Blautia marasmi]